MHVSCDISDCTAFLFMDQNYCLHALHLLNTLHFTFSIKFADPFVHYGYFALL